MPEIAEVETIKNDLLTSDILRQKIKNIDIYFAKIIKNSKKDFLSSLKNKSINNVFRKGKYLIFAIDDFYLIMHLKMTGHLLLKDKNYFFEKHDLISLTFENEKKLIFYDPRRFGCIYLESNLNILDKTGPDVLSKEFRFDYFFQNLNKKHKKIKTLLLDQTFIAGIGNIYADEILFMAKIHPSRISCEIDIKTAKRLFSSIKKTIKKAIIHRGTSLGKTKLNYTSIHGDFGNNQNYLLIHTKKTCPICFEKVKKIKINQRSSYFCTRCQS